MYQFGAPGVGGGAGSGVDGGDGGTFAMSETSVIIAIKKRPVHFGDHT
jgi:hypothetical protein